MRRSVLINGRIDVFRIIEVTDILIIEDDTSYYRLPFWYWYEEPDVAIAIFPS
jgi:hypothetical protein